MLAHVVNVPSNPPSPQRRLIVEPLHAMRAGHGLDAIMVHARSRGLLVGPGVLQVMTKGGSVVLLRRFPRARFSMWLLGAHGVARAKVSLAPSLPTHPPQVQTAPVPCPMLSALPAAPPALAVAHMNLPVEPVEPVVPDFSHSDECTP